MTRSDAIDLYGRLTTPDTLTFERLLPGPLDRVWAFLTDSDKRRLWLASGDMPLIPGGAFTLTWRNDDLTTPPGTRPRGFGEEHRMACTIVVCDPPHRLAFTWGENGEVEVTLAPEGDEVRLTLIQKRTADRAMRVMVGSGWHAHLDILAARLSGREPDPFWDSWQKRKAEYDTRLPA